MDPLTIMLLAGTALQGIGKLASGAQGGYIADWQANLAHGNTELLRKRSEIEGLGADLARAKATLEETRTREQLDRVLGGETAHYAASNLDPVSGSPLLLQGFSAAQGQVDINLIRARGGVEAAAAHGRAAGTLAEAAGSAGQEASLRMKSDQSTIAGLFGAATSFLQAGSKIFPGLNLGRPGGYSGGDSGGGGDY